MYPLKTLWHNHHRSWLTEEPLDQSLEQDEIIVKADASLVSLGTEKLVISEPLLEDAELRMRVPYMKGNFKENFTYGYSLVGTVVKGSKSLLGKRVHLLHPHQSFAKVKATEAFVLPGTLSTIDATLISNLETAVNAVWDSNPSIGDTIVIQGYGIIGGLIADIVTKIPGVDLTIIEPNRARMSLAIESGYRALERTAETRVSADIAYNTATSDGALQNAIDCTRAEGLTVEMSWYGSKKTTLSLGGSFHYDRKRLISSQVSQIPASKRAYWDYRQRKELTVNLLGSINTEKYLAQSINFDEASDFYNQLRVESPDSLGVLFNY